MISLNPKNRKSFLFKFLLNSIIITFILLTSINALTFSVLYINFKNNEEAHVQSGLEGYRNKYNIVLNNAIAKCNSISQNINIIDILNTTKDETLTQYEISLNLYSYINPFYDEAVQSISIYSANSALFQGEFIKNIETIKNTYAYNQLGDANFMFLNNELTKTIDGRLCFSIYHKVDILHETILCITMYLPETDPYTDNIILTDNISDFKSSKYLNIPLNDTWYAVSSVNFDKLGTQKIFYVFMFFILEIGLLIMSLIITQKINNKTVSEVNRLVEYASLGYSESLDTSFLSETSEYREIEQIKESIRNLINKIQEINKEKATMELEKKDISLKLLQSKMNPHFLYNILSVISYREIKKHDTETVNIINELVAYYRMILSKGKDYISLKEELELIKKYVFLVEISHSKHYDLEIDVPRDMNNIVVPHMLLQPFVENSVIHGLSGNREDCRILIKGYFEDDYIVFTVYDNGHGMNDETLKQMNSITAASTNYGIKNTYERMKLIYGYDFSISYKSEPNVYTEATIRFSKKPKTNE